VVRADIRAGGYRCAAMWERFRRTIVLTALAACMLAAPAQAAELTVYSSLPLAGPARAQAGDVLAGERLALDEAGGVAGPHTVRLVSLTSASRRAGSWVPERVARNAGRAAQDPSTIAYLGDFNSGATAISLPILNDRLIPQISPTNTYVGLTRSEGAEPGEPDKYNPSGVRTFARLAPPDHIQAAAIAALLDRRGADRVFLVDDVEVYGAGLRRMVSRRLRRRGIAIAGRAPLRSRRNATAVARRVARSRADAMVYTGITANGAVPLWRAVHRRAPRLMLVGADGIAVSGFARRIGRGAARRTSLTVAVLAPDSYPAAAQPVFEAFRARHGRDADPYMLYGYEAMRVLLDCIRATDPARPLRPQVRDALFAIRDRDSVLGRYSIDRNGDTTLSSYGVYGVDRRGNLVFDQAIATR
jgi:branched-chain amino acid transport system substrate-binding protein